MGSEMCIRDSVWLKEIVGVCGAESLVAMPTRIHQLDILNVGAFIIEAAHLAHIHTTLSHAKKHSFNICLVATCEVWHPIWVNNVPVWLPGKCWWVSNNLMSISISPFHSILQNGVGIPGLVRLVAAAHR